MMCEKVGGVAQGKEVQDEEEWIRQSRCREVGCRGWK